MTTKKQHKYTKGGEGISLAAFVLPLPESNLPRAEVVTVSSGLGKNIDTAKILTATVEKIAKENGMSAKLTTATVTFGNRCFSSAFGYCLFCCQKNF